MGPGYSYKQLWAPYILRHAWDLQGYLQTDMGPGYPYKQKLVICRFILTNI